MTMSPGWYPDQEGKPLEREWDGSKWTGASRPTPSPVPAPKPDKPELTLFGRILKYVGILAIVVFLFVGCVRLVTQAGGDDEYNGDNEYEAIAQCEARIEDLLKAPATADFNSTATGGGTWTVRGTVDAENGFGALIRSEYQCTVIANDGGTMSTRVDSFG